MDGNFSDIIGNAQQNQQLNMGPVNLDEYPLYECDKCGSVAFVPAMALRRVPGIALGMGDKNQLIPEQILVCAKCHEIFKKDRIYLNLEKKDETSSNIQL